MSESAAGKRPCGKQRTVLPPECIALLGKMSDYALGKRFGVSSTLLHGRRKELGIPPFKSRRQPIVWTEGMLLLVGSDTDLVIAQRLGLPEYAVAYKRKEMGVPSWTGRNAYREVKWTPEMLKKLGKITDEAFMKRFGVGKSSVMTKRHALGINPKRATRKAVEWTLPMLHDLRTMHPTDFAAKYGIGRSTAVMKRSELKIPPAQPKPGRRKIKWTERMRDLLGTKPDAVLARAFHMSISVIQRERRRLGRSFWEPPGQFKWTAERIAMLGTATDAELARRWGNISPATIGRMRNSLSVKKGTQPGMTRDGHAS